MEENKDQKVISLELFTKLGSPEPSQPPILILSFIPGTK